MIMLDHLLDEDRLDRLIAAANVARAKPIGHQHNGRDHDRDQRGDGPSGRDFISFLSAAIDSLSL